MLQRPVAAASTQAPSPTIDGKTLSMLVSERNAIQAQINALGPRGERTRQQNNQKEALEADKARVERRIKTLERAERTGMSVSQARRQGAQQAFSREFSQLTPQQQQSYIESRERLTANDREKIAKSQEVPGIYTLSSGRTIVTTRAEGTTQQASGKYTVNDLQKIAKSKEVPGIYKLSTGEVIVTTRGEGTYVNERGQRVDVRVPIATDAKTGRPVYNQQPAAREVVGFNLFDVQNREALRSAVQSGEYKTPQSILYASQASYAPVPDYRQATAGVGVSTLAQDMNRAAEAGAREASRSERRAENLRYGLENASFTPSGRLYTTVQLMKEEGKSRALYTVSGVTAMSSLAPDAGVATKKFVTGLAVGGAYSGLRKVADVVVTKYGGRRARLGLNALKAGDYGLLATYAISTGQQYRDLGSGESAERRFVRRARFVGETATEIAGFQVGSSYVGGKMQSITEPINVPYGRPRNGVYRTVEGLRFRPDAGRIISRGIKLSALNLRSRLLRIDPSVAIQTGAVLSAVGGVTSGTAFVVGGIPARMRSGLRSKGRLRDPGRSARQRGQKFEVTKGQDPELGTTQIRQLRGQVRERVKESRVVREEEVIARFQRQQPGQFLFRNAEVSADMPRVARDTGVRRRDVRRVSEPLPTGKREGVFVMLERAGKRTVLERPTGILVDRIVLPPGVKDYIPPPEGRKRPVYPPQAPRQRSNRRLRQFTDATTRRESVLPTEKPSTQTVQVLKEEVKVRGELVRVEPSAPSGFRQRYKVVPTSMRDYAQRKNAPPVVDVEVQVASRDAVGRTYLPPGSPEARRQSAMERLRFLAFQREARIRQQLPARVPGGPRAFTTRAPRFSPSVRVYSGRTPSVVSSIESGVTGRARTRFNLRAGSRFNRVTIPRISTIPISGIDLGRRLAPREEIKYDRELIQAQDATYITPFPPSTITPRLYQPPSPIVRTPPPPRVPTIRTPGIDVPPPTIDWPRPDIPPPDVPPRKPPNIPILLGGGGGSGAGMKGIYRQSKRYTPSAYSVALNIRGKRPSTRLVKTGLSVRPIVVPSMKRRGGKRGKR